MRNIIDVNVYATKAATSISKKKSTIRGGKKAEHQLLREEKTLVRHLKEPTRGRQYREEKKTAEIDAFCMVEKKQQLSSFLSSFHIPHF